MAKATSESINWIEGLIIKTFGLTKIVEGFPLLDAWLTVSGELPIEEIQRLEKWRLKLLKNVGTWNEETLKMNFIANIIELVDYDTDEFEGTFDAEMKGVVPDASNLDVGPKFSVEWVVHLAINSLGLG